MKAAQALLLAGAAFATQAAPTQFFDDFSYADAAALEAGGWKRRTAPGHPGVPGATWSADALLLGDDPARRGNRLLTLQARTDGTPAGTVQAQLCHARKYLQGTYAARVRFADAPSRGAGGDPVIQTFYAVAPLRFDHDPRFSEIDWEYLSQGGWGSDKPRLYAIAWQTVRVEPWDAHNAAHETFGRFGGWRTLVVQVGAAQSRWFIDGRELVRHGGRNHPVVPMALSFNLWFSPGGLQPPSAEPRQWQQQVDWVLHAAGEQLGPAEVEARVRGLRQRGVARVDTVPAPQPPLASSCDF
jgi:hypothetical protein